MEDRKTITIAIALSAAMVLMFIGVIIYARVRKQEPEETAEKVVTEEVVADEAAVVPEMDEEDFHSEL